MHIRRMMTRRLVIPTDRGLLTIFYAVSFQG